MRRPTRFAGLATALPIAVVTVVAAAAAFAQSKPTAPCPQEYPTAVSEAREAQAAYLLAEAQGRPGEACAHARLYIKVVDRIIAAAGKAPRTCLPSSPTLLVQYYHRDQTIWRGKAARACPGATVGAQRHQIIHVPSAAAQSGASQ